MLEGTQEKKKKLKNDSKSGKKDLKTNKLFSRSSILFEMLDYYFE